MPSTFTGGASPYRVRFYTNGTVAGELVSAMDADNCWPKKGTESFWLQVAPLSSTPENR